MPNKSKRVPAKAPNASRIRQSIDNVKAHLERHPRDGVRQQLLSTLEEKLKRAK